MHSKVSWQPLLWVIRVHCDACCTMPAASYLISGMRWATDWIPVFLLTSNHDTLDRTAMHFMGPKKQAVVAMLRSFRPKKHLPILLGMYEVQAQIVCDGGEWNLVRMVVNDAAAAAEGARRLTAGEPWMPEMRGAFLEPGNTLARASSADELANHIEGTNYSFLE